MSQAQIRSVTVRFDADIAAYLAKCELVKKATDGAVPDRRNIAASNQALGETSTKLDDVSRSGTRATTTTRALGREVDTTSRKFDNGAKSIDRYSGRLGVFLDLALGLGPALIPIAAEAIPLVTALGANLGFLAAGGGTAVLALHGVGDALTAMNKYALEPTDANLVALNDKLKGLPPSAQRLVLQLHRLVPEFLKLRTAAADGFLPGLSSGIRSAADDLPLLQRVLHGVGLELGDLARDTGRSLSSERWRPFLRFIGREAPPAIDDMARSAGHLTHGLAELVIGFQPLTTDVDQGILNLAKDFDHWATSARRTKDFQAFLDYLRANGPRVIELLGQTGATLVAIATAVAPLGGPTIDILTNLLEIIEKIADSDLGTPLFGALIALRLFGRVAQLTGVEVEGSFRGMARAPGQMGTKLGTLTEQTSRWSRTTIADISAVTRAFAVAGRESFANPTRPLAMSQERLKSRLGTAAKGAGLAAGLAFIGTGAADSIGLANTASLALAGSFAGLPGAIAGGTIGFFLDAAHANDALADSANKARDAVSGEGAAFNFQTSNQALRDLQNNIDDSAKARDDFFASSGASATLPGALKEGAALIGDFFTHTSDDAKQAEADVVLSNANIATAFGTIFDQLGGNTTGPGGISLVTTTQQLQQTADRAQPAMLALGISVGDLQAAAAKGDGSLQGLVDQIVHFVNRSDSVSQRTSNVAKAIADMGDESLTTEQKVTALSTALDALIDPMLNLGQARDAFRQGLNDLSGDLVKNHKVLTGTTDAAIQNRNAIRTQATNLKDLVNKQAEAGVSGDKMTQTLKDGRKAIIEQGAAAGLNRGELTRMIDKMNLTPKLIETTLSLLGTDQSLNELGKVNHALLGLRDRVIHVRVVSTREGSATLSTGGRTLTGADGMTIPGQRQPYGDKTLILAAPGEELISNRHGQADAFRRDRSAGRIPAYADGGTVGRWGTPATPSAGSGSFGGFGPLAVTGTLDTPWGPAEVNGIAEAAATRVYRTEKTADDRFEEARR